MVASPHSYDYIVGGGRRKEPGVRTRSDGGNAGTSWAEGRDWHSGGLHLAGVSGGRHRMLRMAAQKREFRKPSYGAVVLLLRRRRRGFAPDPRPRKPGHTPRNAGNRPHPAASETPYACARRPAY